MQLNCKIGDTAIVIGESVHVGKLVKIIEAAPKNETFKLPNCVRNAPIDDDEHYWIFKSLSTPFEGAQGDGMYGSGRDSRLIPLPKVAGYITYEVSVTCPRCKRELDLYQDPYDNEESEFSPAEDELGLALFGRVDAPAQWQNLAIQYQCHYCKNHFCVGSLTT
ncbi:hypothetical protein [uncultured Zhongshania sp.]|uniref:hypothetical protein n=1 Tax=uncultured Zhongshania sp. TaxID=1642288 RepID=UPI0030D8BE54